MNDVLTSVCKKILKTGEWQTDLTKSLVINLPKEGNLQLYQNYRTISFISHPSKVMLKNNQSRLQPQAEKKEQAGFRTGRSTKEQICDLRIPNEKKIQHRQDLYHVFIDFKKAFDIVWHEALWGTMRKYNINASIIQAIENLYNKSNRNAMNRNWSNMKANPTLKTKAGNK